VLIKNSIQNGILKNKKFGGIEMAILKIGMALTRVYSTLFGADEGG
jgi:hypothetical protein